MGLRERKAEAKRGRIIEEALQLFSKKGFVNTSSEEIAEAAELSLSTLYRCFPSKDLIVLAAFNEDAALLAEHLEAVPDIVPVAGALTMALAETFQVPDQQSDRALLLRAILDKTPAIRARLWDMLSEQRDRIGQEIARRCGLDAHDPRVILSARLSFLIAETAADLWRDPRNDRPAWDIARDLIRIVAEGELVAPKVLIQLNEERVSRAQGKAKGQPFAASERRRG